MITGLRRSSLYVPGDNEKMLRKSAGIAADLLLLNLEDGVALSRKDEARENVARALRDLDFGAREIVVRVNSMASEVGKRDLSAVVPRRPDGICLPKVESAGKTITVKGNGCEGTISGRFNADEGTRVIGWAQPAPPSTTGVVRRGMVAARRQLIPLRP